MNICVKTPSLGSQKLRHFETGCAAEFSASTTNARGDSHKTASSHERLVAKLCHCGEAIAGRRTAVTRAAAPAVKKKKKMPVVTASRKKPVKQTAPQRVAEPNPKISATQERDDDADEEADAVSNDADD